MMIKTKIYVLLFLSVLLVNALPAWSQKKAELISTKWAGNAVYIDGSLNDWNDSLTLYNEATKLYYSLANDENNLYLAIRNTSKESLAKILAAGISFSANIESNRKNPPKVTFPVLDRTAGRNRTINSQETDIKEMQKQTLSRIKQIRVGGFREIIDGGISLYNTYGIKAAVAFDSNNNLVQEIAIPLSLLNLTAGSSDLITYNIKINGLKSPAEGTGQRQGNQSYGMGGMYGRQYPRATPINKALSSTEFYIKSKLAARK